MQPRCNGSHFRFGFSVLLQMADRANSLSVCSLVKWVASLARGFSGLHFLRGFGNRRSVHVDLLSDRLKMMRVHANYVLTFVINDKTFRYWPPKKLPRDTVGVPFIGVRECELPVSRTASHPEPASAVRLRRYKSHESFFYGDSLSGKMTLGHLGSFQARCSASSLFAQRGAFFNYTRFGGAF